MFKLSYIKPAGSGPILDGGAVIEAVYVITPQYPTLSVKAVNM